MTERFTADIRHYTGTRRLDLAADPRAALIAAPAKQITVLEALASRSESSDMRAAAGQSPR